MLTAQVHELSFGGSLGGTLEVNGSAVLRTLPPAGAGLCLNYLLDGPGQDNGTALQQALQVRGPLAVSRVQCQQPMLSCAFSLHDGHGHRHDRQQHCTAAGPPGTWLTLTCTWHKTTQPVLACCKKHSQTHG